MINRGGHQTGSERVFYVVALVFTGIISASLFYVFDLITELGRNIPQLSFASDYSTALFWAVALTIGLVIYPFPREETRAMLFLWLARCATTLGVMLVYEYTYGLDAYSYFEASKNHFFDWSKVEFGKGTQFIMAFSWFLNNYLPLNDSYHALKVIYSFIGLIASFIFYRGFTYYTGEKNINLLYWIGLFPSNLFWSSILGKDPVVYFGIAIYTYGVLKFFKRHQFISLFYVAAGILIAANVRLWIGLIMMAPVAFTLLITSKMSWGRRLMYSPIVVALLVWTGMTFLDKFSIDSTQELVSQSSAVSSGWAKGGSAQQVQAFLNVKDMLSFAPKGMFTALFRPLPFELNSVFGFIAGLENFVLLAIFLIALKRWQIDKMREPAVIWATTFVFIWSLFYGFVSYQNLGTAVRFKLQILPIFLTLLLYMVSLPKVAEAKALDDSDSASKKAG